MAENSNLRWEYNITNELIERKYWTGFDWHRMGRSYKSLSTINEYLGPIMDVTFLE